MKARPLEIRFREKLGPQDPVTGCIEWTAGRLHSGYGRISSNGTSILATRVAWELANGPIPEDLKVLHTCDNPPCCNLGHLFLGTMQDNTDDMISKGRDRKNSPKGSRHNKAKLTEASVLEIRSRLAQRERAVEIARHFGITFQTVYRIKSRAIWSHI